MQRDEIQNLLKSQDLGTVKPSAFKQVGNPIFPDQSATLGMATVREVVDTFRAVHSPAFGSIIPQSGKSVSVIGDSGQLLALDGNEVARIFILAVSPTTLPESVTLFVDGLPYVTGSTDPLSAVNLLAGMQPLFVDSTQVVTFTAVSATQTVSIGYNLVSQ